MELANTIQSKDLTLEEIVETAYMMKDKFVTEDNTINVIKLKLMLSIQANIKVGQNKAYEIREALRIKYPNDFS